jgi:cell division protein FtsB
MKFITIILIFLLLLIQINIWFKDDGYPRITELKSLIQNQKRENSAMVTRNTQLREEMEDFKKGDAAIEERARTDIGMIKEGEEFYLITQPKPVLEEANSD